MVFILSHFTLFTYKEYYMNNSLTQDSIAKPVSPSSRSTWSEEVKEFECFVNRQMYMMGHNVFCL